MTVDVEGEARRAQADSDRPPEERPRASWLARHGRLLESAMLPLAFAALIAGFGIHSPNQFLTLRNFSNIFGSQAVLFVLTMALLVPLTNNDLDLSVGSLAGLVSMIVAVLNVNDGLGIVWCIVIGLAVGLLCGLINGLIVVRFDVNPFIITLATGTVFSGVQEWLSKEQTIVGVSTGLSEWTFNKELLSIPLEFWYGVVIMLIAWFVLTFTPFGQRCLFVGQSHEVARLSGFNVGRIRLQGFTIAGLVAGIAGVLYVGTTGSASPGTGADLLLPAYAAAFLGLTTIQPRRFNAIGAGLSVYFLATGVSGLELLGAQDYVQSLFYGVVLVIAVVLSRLVGRRQLG
ncbi:MAG TPA: ABC transporter permease [Solirubrobacteraceae bacterium]|nr:ABC transporter permease [Solirubrobacteraceae bacterium]